MIQKMINSEIEYAKSFSESMTEGKIMRFWDKNLPDMYSHNFTLLMEPLDVKKRIRDEIERRKGQGADFLRIEINFPVEKEWIEGLPITPEVSLYDYMAVKTDQYPFLKGNPDCAIKEAISDEVMKDGMNVDIEANQGVMGRAFAEKRIYRKMQVYGLPESKIRFFVCYHKNIPVGNCECMMDHGIAKIEDFDILEKYQRKGFGTSVLQHLLRRGAEAGVRDAYLITDHSDTAKEMYHKCGFTKAGEKTELFFRL